jgi:alpha-tubulin suppressor-like RCC1 family protein
MRRLVVAVLVANVVFACVAAASSSASVGALGWGLDSVGQVGVDDTVPFSSFKFGNVFEPAPLGTLSGVPAISPGGEFALGLLEDGTVMAWGENESDQLGRANSGPEFCEAVPCSKLPVPVTGLSGVAAVAAGYSHSLALLKNGHVMAWGNDLWGQLGLGSSGGPVASPTVVPGLSGVTAIAAGAHDSFALLENGTVEAWGDLESGQLGISATGTKCGEAGAGSCLTAPTAVPGLEGVRALAAGGAHALALLTDGTVRSWGSNPFGEVGDGTQTTRFSPVAVSGLTEVVAIGAGESYSNALLAGGTVMEWGTNREGELGIGNNTGPEECLVHAPAPSPCSTVPIAVPGLSGVKQVAAGRSNSLALLEDGRVMAWGWDNYASLGVGETGTESCFGTSCETSPTPVSGLDDAVTIAAGGYTGFAGVTLGASRPTVSSVSPEAVPTEHPATITITGSNLAGATAVTFGSTNASSFTVNADGSITATSRSLPNQTVDVAVRTPEGYSAFSPADRFAFQVPPTVGPLAPAEGSTLGGTRVIFHGQEFAAVSAVRFGSINATSYKVLSPTAIEAVTPAEPVGKILVTVVNTAGTSPGSPFKFTPIVESIAPNSGPTSGGTQVTVTGAGFTTGENHTIIKFGSVKASKVTCSSSTSCLVTAPAHAAGKVDVRATVNKITSPTHRPGDQFKYS